MAGTIAGARTENLLRALPPSGPVGDVLEEIRSRLSDPPRS
jgi:hypothetical protein